MSSRTPRARELAQELVAAVIAMYGDGLARIIEVIGESREAGATILDELAQDGAVASLLLIHDLYPVVARGAGARGARHGAARTWSPTAATSSCSGSRTGSRSWRCRAAATAAPRRGRRSSWRSSRRSTSTRPTSPASRSQGVTEPAAGRGRRPVASSCRWSTRSCRSHLPMARRPQPRTLGRRSSRPPG